MTTAVQKQWEPHGGVMPKTLVPQQRMGNEEELAGTVLYLASKVGPTVLPCQKFNCRPNMRNRLAAFAMGL
jgi:hypothetical protein